ncbi:MAG: hypothetical protein IKL29_00715 [Bacteroidaceae bacterium]|nr:hypothetical protein [Bacteroidaceae bacterium]
MKEIINNEEKRVEQLLTPKYAPKCKVQFTVSKKRREINIRRGIRLAGIAAILSIVVVIGLRGIASEEMHAAVPANEWLEQALQQLQKRSSMIIEYRTSERINIGLPQKGNSMIDGKLTFLRDNSTTYMREEYDDEYKTVAIYSKDSLYLWQNGELQKKIIMPMRPARYEFLFINSIDKFIEGDTLKCDAEDVKSITVLQKEKKIIIETEPFADVACFLTFVATTATANELEHIRLALKDEMGETHTYLESTKILHNPPITKEAVLKTPF